MERSFIAYNPTILTYKGFYKNVKVEVHERDGNVCQLCSSDKFMVTHHINYDKQNSHPMNLITLCNDCHKKTYNHKNDWLKLFTERMLQRFSGEYRAYLATIQRKALFPKLYKNHPKNGPVIIVTPPTTPAKPKNH